MEKLLSRKKESMDSVLNQKKHKEDYNKVKRRQEGNRLVKITVRSP